MKDRDFLMWLHNLLENLHHEAPTLEYMQKLRAIALATPAKQETAIGVGSTSPWKSCDSPPNNPRDVRLVTHAGQYMEAHYLTGGHCIEDHPPVEAGWYHWTGTYYDQVPNPAKWMDIPR